MRERRFGWGCLQGRGACSVVQTFSNNGIRQGGETSLQDIYVLNIDSWRCRSIRERQRLIALSEKCVRPVSSDDIY